MLANYASSSGLAAPQDKTITSLYLTSVPSASNNSSTLTGFFTPLLTGPSGLKNIVPVSATSCAFLNFSSREEAEHVANQLAMKNVGKDKDKVKIEIGESEVGVQWGRSRKPKAAAAAAEPSSANPVEASLPAVAA